MPDPNWTVAYNFGNTPEANGFTRFIHPPEPLVTLVTSGSPANRRIEVDTSAGGDISFLTSNVPNLNEAIGMTAEATVHVSGPGDVGFEATFLNFPVAINIFVDRVFLERLGEPAIEVLTPSNAADIIWRVTYDGTNIRVYRAGALVIGPVAPVLYSKPSQQFQFWVESGAVAIYRALKYYLGGAVVPG